MSRTKLLLSGCILAISVLLLQAAPATSGRALTIEDYYRIQMAGNPEISPDGKWVVFTVSTRIEEDNGTRTECWIVAADRSAPARRLLHYGRDVSNPRWNREGWLEYAAGGLWKIDPQIPAATPARSDSLPSGAVLSPDGKWIASTKDKLSPKRE